MNSTLPLKLTLELSEMQKGAMSAKEDVFYLSEQLNKAYEASISNPRLLETSQEVISKILDKIGELTEFQKGFIYSLLEYSEINTECHLSLEDWYPSLITGEWQ